MIGALPIDYALAIVEMRFRPSTAGGRVIIIEGFLVTHESTLHELLQFLLLADTQPLHYLLVETVV